MDENGIRSMSDGESAMIETYNAGFDAIIENSLPEEKWPNGFKEAMDGLNALAASDDVRNFIEERGNDFIDEIMNVRMGILTRWSRYCRVVSTNRLRRCASPICS